MNKKNQLKQRLNLKKQADVFHPKIFPVDQTYP